MISMKCFSDSRENRKVYSIEYKCAIVDVCRYILVVECNLPKVNMRVRFPLSAPFENNLRTMWFVSFFKY